MLQRAFAHKGEIHESEPSILHYFENQVIISIVFFTILVLTITILKKLGIKTSTISNTTLLLFFMMGTIGWYIAPTLATISIALGFSVALAPFLLHLVVTKNREESNQ